MFCPKLLSFERAALCALFTMRYAYVSGECASSINAIVILFAPKRATLGLQLSPRCIAKVVLLCTKRTAFAMQRGLI